MKNIKNLKISHWFFYKDILKLEFSPDMSKLVVFAVCTDLLYPHYKQFNELTICLKLRTSLPNSKSIKIRNKRTFVTI